MLPNDVLYLTKVSRDPNPFISTGKYQKHDADEKTAFFRELLLYPQVIGVPTGPKDIKFLFGFSQKYPSTGNQFKM
jgi:hypothetical protein